MFSIIFLHNILLNESIFFLKIVYKKDKAISLKEYKIIISGLDNAGKTSILTSFDKRYNFEKKIMELEPTRKVEYHHTEFMGKSVHFWDMGGQDRYRTDYQSNPDFYFADTDLIIFVIDIQDSSRHDSSLQYLNRIMGYFKENNMNTPLVVAFHKNDPKLKDDPEILKNVKDLTERIFKIKELKMLFIQTSIYRIHSIVDLISFAHTVIDDKHLELNELFKKYLDAFNSKSLVLFDKNGIIIGEIYTDSLEYDVYLELMESLKEHIVLLKKMQEKGDYKDDQNFNSIKHDLLSFLHRIRLKNEIFYLSVLIEKSGKQILLDKLSDFIYDLSSILETMI